VLHFERSCKSHTPPHPVQTIMTPELIDGILAQRVTFIEIDGPGHPRHRPSHCWRLDHKGPELDQLRN
jgi:hypothetical protein